jgi:hypothetical protein
MNEAAVDSHAAHAGRLRDALVRYDPSAFRKPFHLHREGHCRIERADAHVLEPPHDAPGGIVDLVPLAMKFQVGDRTRGRADRFAMRAADQRQERAGGGKRPRDVCALRGQSRVVDRRQAAIVGAALARQRQEAARGEGGPRRLAGGYVFHCLGQFHRFSADHDFWT